MVIFKIILNKSTGNVSVLAFDSEEGLIEKITPIDTYVQIIEGKAKLVISGISSFLITGQSIVILTHAPNFMKPNGRFKMIKTLIISVCE